MLILGLLVGLGVTADLAASSEDIFTRLVQPRAGVPRTVSSSTTATPLTGGGASLWPLPRHRSIARWINLSPEAILFTILPLLIFETSFSSDLHLFMKQIVPVRTPAAGYRGSHRLCQFWEGRGPNGLCTVVYGAGADPGRACRAVEHGHDRADGTLRAAVPLGLAHLPHVRGHDERHGPGGKQAACRATALTHHALIGWWVMEMGSSQ